MPIGVYYAPILLWLILQRFRGERIRFLCLTNPAFPYGGMFGASKIDQLALLNENQVSTPFTRVVAADAAAQLTADEFLDVGVPGIVKPDVAGRSRGVKIFRTQEDADAIRREYAGLGQGYLVQQYITGEEYAVFYARNPETGTLSVVDAVHREHFYVVGDGASTLAELVEHAGRGIPEKILPNLGEAQNRVLADGERARIGRLGLHSHGCEFIKTDAAIEPPLSEMTERLQNIETLDFFRVDVIVRDSNYYVLEINGVLAEPLSAYAPGTTTREFYERFFDIYAKGLSIGKSRYLKGAPLPTRMASLREMQRYSELARRLS